MKISEYHLCKMTLTPSLPRPIVTVPYTQSVLSVLPILSFNQSERSKPGNLTDETFEHLIARQKDEAVPPSGVL